MALPIMGTPEEAKVFTTYLNKRINGCKIEDIKAATGKVVDPRKVAAYIFWGLAQKDGEKIKLTSLGRQLSTSESDEDRQLIFLKIIKSVDAYLSMIEMIYYNKEKDSISNIEAASYWVSNPKFEMENDNENTLKDRAVCFFKICEAAGLGTYFLGRKGKATRLEIKRERLEKVFACSDLDSTPVPLEICEENILEQPIAYTSSLFKDVDAEIECYKENKETETIPFVVSFVDGRKATLHMPKKANTKDAEYVFDMLKLILTRQYEFER